MSDITIPIEPITYGPIEIDINQLEVLFSDTRRKSEKILALFLGTKPCFNKAYTIINACENANVPIFIINTNQHYDHNLTYMIDEFNLRKHICINLKIQGDLTQKAVELWHKTVELSKFFKARWSNINVVPLVIGDTIIAPMVTGAWLLSTNQYSIHLEAGLRSMKPKFFNKEFKNMSPEDFLSLQATSEWDIDRSEPFPEQWDTFVTGAGCKYHFAPLAINKEHLQREGYKGENIHVIGGLVPDAINKVSSSTQSSIFTLYPQLRKGKWIRMDIHRRENIEKERFLAIFETLERLVKEGHQINFVLMNTTKHAIKQHGLQSRLNDLSKEKNVLVTDVWPAFNQVLELYKSENFECAITDSGGVQEDMNILGKPCITIRNSTDRPETVISNNGNLLIPPISKEFLTKTLQHILQRKNLKIYNNKNNIYGENAGKKFVKHITKYL